MPGLTMLAQKLQHRLHISIHTGERLAITASPGLATSRLRLPRFIPPYCTLLVQCQSPARPLRRNPG
ncbi:hypothetical protein KIF59_21095 [Enterobacter cloacae subsp. cloacae]|nr:hypothetical protein [Enterobacter cloacae subsp. cloacae]